MHRGIFVTTMAALAGLFVLAMSISYARQGVAWHFVNRVLHAPRPDLTPMTPEAHRRDLDARKLARDQQCVAGTVVTVRPRFAEQVLIQGQIVHCKGRLADTPLR